MNPERPANRISQRQLAKMLGISHVTVSMALRDNLRISEPVRKRVQELAKSMDYKPDPMLSSLAKYRLGRTQRSIRASIAWINAWRQPDDLRSFKEFDAYWRGAETAARNLGYRLEEFRLDSETSPKRLHQILQARAITGILLPPHSYLPPAWGDFPWDHYVIVRFGRTLESPLSHLVTADQVTNSMIAVEAMRSRGYKRIGFVTTGSDLQRRGTHFAAGFLCMQQEMAEKDRIPLLKLPDASMKDLAVPLKQWMKKHQPEAILTTVADTGRILTEAGYTVGEDVGLAVTSILDCDVDAGINQHPEEIGRVGLLMLSSLINDGAIGIPTIFRQNLVKGAWVDGKSLPQRA